MKRFYHFFLLSAVSLGTWFLMANATDDTETWWRRPGIGISYSVEYRPDWAWNRDYIEYNAGMMDEDGMLIYDGPDYNIGQAVNLTDEVGADYHMFYTKWHDGICYFDTELTSWKSPKDYTADFSRWSKERNIPFTLYYSSIFDHNPQFDHIQPIKRSTISFIQHPEYLNYIQGQYQELVEQYAPDGLFFDFWWEEPHMDATRTTTVDYMRNNYLDLILTSNLSGDSGEAAEVLDYTTNEIHTLNDEFSSAGNYFRNDLLNTLTTRFTSFAFDVANGWRIANENRKNFEHFWSAITPVGLGWTDPAIRPDIYELPRIGAMVMACGGHNTMQVNFDVDGDIFPDQVEQMRLVGEWYEARKDLFNGASALRYSGEDAPGINAPPGYRTIASRSGDDVLIHVIKLDDWGRNLSDDIAINRFRWSGIREVYIEPEHRRVQMRRFLFWNVVQLNASDEDPVDTILRLKF